jgi:hypothetical protein
MFKVKEGLRLFNNQTTVRYPTGNYGSFEIDGGAKGGYEGYSIGGRVNFMHNNSTEWGIYNDVDNEWCIRGIFNGSTELWYNGVKKIHTTSDGGFINDTLYLGATDSGDSHFYFGEDSSGWYGEHTYWDSGHTTYHYSRHAGTDSLIYKHDTRYTHKINLARGLERTGHSTGYFIGSYNSVEANSAKTNPIYTIGDSYRPTDTSFSNMYGIGYAHNNMWGGGKSNGWGLYVNENGRVFCTLSADGMWHEDIGSVWGSSNDGSGSGLDADLLDGQHGSYYAPASHNHSLTLSGDVSGSGSVSGTISVTVNNDSHSHSNYMPIRNSTPYTVPTATTWGSFNLGNGTMIQAAGTGRPSGSTHGYWFVGGKRDVSGGYAGLYFNHYSGGNGLFIGGHTEGSSAPNWERVWTSNTDGSGSGLDADLLDGQHGSYYAPANHNHTLTLSGDVSGSGSVSGTISVTVNNDSHSHSNYLTTTGKAADSSLLDGIGIGSFLRSDATDYLNGVMYVRADIRNETAYRDHGVYGSYDSTKTNHIWSMGSSYRNSTDGSTFGTLYGLAYKHTNNATGGTMGGGHQMVWCNNGSPRGAIGYDRVWHASGMRVGSSDVWHAGNDGSGSGLDADLLDGQHGSYYYSAANLPPKIKAGGTGPSTENLNTIANSVSTGQLEYRGFNSSSSNSPPVSDNANGVITVGQHSGNYNAQLAFSSNGNMYWRDNPSSSFGSWRTVWDSGNDGSGSGLDADLLDGQQGSYYAPASHNHSGVYLPIGGKAADSELLDGVNGASYLRSDADDSFTGNNLLFPSLSLNIANNNGAGSGNTYFRGNTSHFVVGLTSGNTLYMNYGNSAGAFRTEGTITHNSALVGTTPWGNSNDGSGSGLDADLLDGQQGSYYAPASHSHSYLPLSGGSLTGNLNLPLANAITFYGNGSNDHSIMSRSWTGATADDLRINSYGGITLNLDSNNNNTSGKGLIIGRHGASTGSVEKFIEVAGETCWTQMYDTSSGTGFTYMSFKSATGGTTYGSIYRAYSSITYATSSDYRLKENVVDLTGASERLKQIPVKRFNFIEHPERTVDGFIAHEVQEVVPEAVVGNKDDLDKEGNPVYQGVDQSKLVPLLVASLQEALAEIDNLKARVSALEN